MNIKKCKAVRSYIDDQLNVVYKFQYLDTIYKLKYGASDFKLYQLDLGLEYQVFDTVDLKELFNHLQDQLFEDRLNTVMEVDYEYA